MNWEQSVVTEKLSPVGSSFPTTHWTLVSRVRHGGEVRRLALEELCGLYWYPIYAFLRRRGYFLQDAEDLAQGFFLKLVGDETFAAADADKGKLRTYLLGHLKRHLADHHRHVGAQKRGRGLQFVSFDAMEAEERYAAEPRDVNDPEALFSRAWALQLLAAVRGRLREEFNDPKRPHAFETLQPYLLLDEDPPSYREVALKLKATEVSVRLTVSRMRAKFRELLREEVARTVEAPEEVTSEFEWLRSVLSPP